MYDWQWGVLLQYKDVFLEGALVTIWLTVLAIIVGTLLGLGVSLARRSGFILLPQLARIYTELFRGLPILVLLIWIFYVLPLLFGIMLSPFVAAFIALSLNLSAYVAETIRAGIDAIPRNQYESGITLGLHPFQVMFLIVLPQAFRNALPNLLGLYIEELKNSSLASVIAVNELLHRANEVISNTYRPLEIYTAVAVIYLAIVIPVTILSGVVEKRLAKQKRDIVVW